MQTQAQVQSQPQDKPRWWTWMVYLVGINLLIYVWYQLIECRQYPALFFIVALLFNVFALVAYFRSLHPEQTRKGVLKRRILAALCLLLLFFTTIACSGGTIASRAAFAFPYIDRAACLNFTKSDLCPYEPNE
jgi:hypothetical protein